MDESVWVHNLDPFLVEPFSVFGLFNFPGIRYYGLAYFTGFVAGYFIISWMAKRRLSPIKVPEVADFITYIILGVMLGGRLGYVFFYSPDLLTKFSGEFPFWGALEVHKGGMASHGGMIGVVVACILFGRRYKMSPLHVGDLSILGASIGIFLGRVANFINGELMGRVVEKPISWAVKFPRDMERWTTIRDGNTAFWRDTYQPKLEKLTEAVSHLRISAEEWVGYVQNYPVSGRAQRIVGEVFERLRNSDMANQANLDPQWLAVTRDTVSAWKIDTQPKLEALKEFLPNLKISASEWVNAVQSFPSGGRASNFVYDTVNRLMEAPSNGNTEAAAALGKVLEPRHPSQLYAAISEGFIPFLFIVFLWRKAQKPGVIGAAFLTLYPISRIINEQFRLPDAHLGYQLLGLTRGQWLSVAMFFMAGAYLIWCLKRKSEPIGGWSNMEPVIVEKEVEAEQVQETSSENQASDSAKPDKKNSSKKRSNKRKKRKK